MNIRYRFKKWRVRFSKQKEKSLDLSDVQKKVYDIIIQMINEKESVLHYTPTTARRGIENGSVFVFINQHKLSVINGVYHYDVGIDDRIHSHIVSKFNDKLERKFNAKENQVTSKVKNSLDNISKKLTEEKK
jgi:hypothetical protein